MVGQTIGSKLYLKVIGKVGKAEAERQLPGITQQTVIGEMLQEKGSEPYLHSSASPRILQEHDRRYTGRFAHRCRV